MAKDETQFETIIVELESPVATITLNRPDRRNAVDPVMIDEFDRTFDLLADRDDISVVVIKGNGLSFCTGYDMKAHYRGAGVGEAEAKRAQYEDLQWNRRTVARWTQLWDMPKITIAQVHGYCIAGGLMIALQCDLVYAAADAKFGQPIARRMAMTPDLALWPLTIGLRRTKELLLTGDLVTGEEAAAIGMINRSLPPEQLDDFVRWISQRVALESPGMLQTHKHAVNEAADAMGYRQVLAAGIHADTLQHYLDENHRFRGLVQGSEDVKSAVSDRDDAHGGVVTLTDAWERELDRLAAERA